VPDPIRLLLVDDHTLFRQGLHRLLDDHPRFTVVGEAAQTEEAVRRARRLQPDIAILAMDIPGGAIEATRALRAEVSSIQVLILTLNEDEDSLLAAVRAGAKGVVLKTFAFEQLVRSLETVASGEVAFSRDLTNRLLLQLSNGVESSPPPRSRSRGDLSERELEILRLVTHGASNRQIANQLCLSENTVRTHLAHIFEKLGIDNRVQAVAYALRNGLA
jgi:DNA-binding NarL/FixJ family response regulator